MKKIVLYYLLILCSVHVMAQEESDEEVSKSHKIAFVLGLTHIPEAFEEGHLEKAVYVPTIGLDYLYQLNETWSLGLALDLELGNYLVGFDRENLARENAIVTAALLGYEIAPRWGLLVGPGIEFEKNKNLFIFRAGTEYEFELGNDWGLFPSFNFDFKEKYSTWALSLGISKRL
jgi:hypothetical protein